MKLWFYIGTGGVEQGIGRYFFSSKAAAWKSYRQNVRDNLDEDEPSVFSEPAFFEMPSSPTRAQIVQTLNRFGGA